MRQPRHPAPRLGGGVCEGEDNLLHRCQVNAKSLEQTLNKDAGQPQDKRVRIRVAQVEELLGLPDFQDDASSYAVWVDTSQMLADVLTKVGCERGPLLNAMSSGLWRLGADRFSERAEAHDSCRKACTKSRPGQAKDGCERSSLTACWIMCRFLKRAKSQPRWLGPGRPFRYTRPIDLPPCLWWDFDYLLLLLL